MSTDKHPADVLASALLSNSELWHNLAPAAHQLRRIPALEKLAAERLAQMEADRKQALQWRDERDALRAQVEQLRNELNTAVCMLAAWCAAVEGGGSGWDYWDDHYKAAMYQPGPLRERLDAAIAAERGTGTEGGAA